jgi:hypothetical protein
MGDRANIYLEMAAPGGNPGGIYLYPLAWLRMA